MSISIETNLDRNARAWLLLFLMIKDKSSRADYNTQGYKQYYYNNNNKIQQNWLRIVLAPIANEILYARKNSIDSICSTEKM